MNKVGKIMAYETNIGENQLLYQITLTGTPTLVKDLLHPNDLDELINWGINTFINFPTEA